MLYVSPSVGDPECLISYVIKVPIVSCGDARQNERSAHEKIRLAALLVEFGV